MRNTRLLAVFSILLVALLPAAGHADGFKTASPGPDAAQISGIPGLPGQDIFEVNFIEINGQNIVPRNTIWLEPGTYTIKVQILAEFRRPPAYRANSLRDHPGHNVIELELEAGKAYQIRGRFNREGDEGDGAPFSVVLHRVDEVDE